MVQRALQTPEIAYIAISIGLSACLVFAVFVFIQTRRSRKNNPQSQGQKQSDSKN